MDNEMKQPIWRYESAVGNDDGDVRKLDHIAINDQTGETVSIDYTPYAQIPPDVFQAFVALGFPPRPNNGPWTDREVWAALSDLRRDQRMARDLDRRAVA